MNSKKKQNKKESSTLEHTHTHTYLSAVYGSKALVSCALKVCQKFFSSSLSAAAVRVIKDMEKIERERRAHM